MVVAVALVFTLVSGAPGDLQLDASVATLGRSRTLLPSRGPSTTTAEAMVMPRLAAGTAWSDVSAGVSYQPVLSAPDLTTSSTMDVLHVAEARGQLRLDGPWRLSGVAMGSRGTTDLLAESRRNPADLQTLTSTGTLTYRAVRGDLRLEGALDPRTSVVAAAGWFLDGGEDAASRAILPVQRGARAEGTLRWSATPLDRLDGRVAGTRADLLQRTTYLVEATGTWRRHLARTRDVWLGGGVVGADTQDPGTRRTRAYPALELGISDADPARGVSLQLVARTGAVIDRATGEAAPQLELVGSARWRLATAWALSTRTAAADSRLSAGDVRRLSAEHRLDWTATRSVVLGAGVFLDWQLAAAPGLPSVREGGVFVAAFADVTGHHPVRDGAAP